jgi:hypothetical protein
MRDVPERGEGEGLGNAQGGVDGGPDCNTTLERVTFSNEIAVLYFFRLILCEQEF